MNFVFKMQAQFTGCSDDATLCPESVTVTGCSKIDGFRTKIDDFRIKTMEFVVNMMDFVCK